MGTGQPNTPSVRSQPRPDWATVRQSGCQEQALLKERMGSQVIGGPETVRDRLMALTVRTRADELIITTAVHAQADRIRSYELIAEAVGLRPTAATA